MRLNCIESFNKQKCWICPRNCCFLHFLPTFVDCFSFAGICLLPFKSRNKKQNLHIFLYSDYFDSDRDTSKFFQQYEQISTIFHYHLYRVAFVARFIAALFAGGGASKEISCCMFWYYPSCLTKSFYERPIYSVAKAVYKNTKFFSFFSLTKRMS